MLRHITWSLAGLIVFSAALIWGYEVVARNAAESFQRDVDTTIYDLVSQPEGEGLAGSVWRARVLGTCGFVHELDLIFD